MKKKIIVLILAAICLFTLSGCWDYEEYESMALVVGVGIDYDQSTQLYTFTVQYSLPSKGSGKSDDKSSSQSQSVVNSATDKTIYGAVSKLQQSIDQRLFFGYLKVIIYGAGAAKKGILSSMDLHDRSPAVPFTTSMLITPGKAQDLIKTASSSSDISSCQQIYDLLQESSSIGAAYPTTMQKLEEALAVGGWEAALPRVVAVTPKNTSSESTLKRDGLNLNQENTGAFVIEGTDVFSGDRLCGELSGQESLGFGWITGKKISSYEVSQTKDKDEDIAYYRIISSGSKIAIHTDGDKPSVDIKIKVQADLRKYFVKDGSDYLSPDEIGKLEKLLSDSVYADAQSALKKCQKNLKSDAFGFGFELFRKSPTLWKTKYQKEWSKLYPKIPVTVSVDAKVLNTGTNIRKFIMQ